MNYSKQRETILKTLTENAVHPTAEALLEFLHEKNVDIGYTTLYRNLNQLVENGIIKKIDGLNSCAHFDHNTYEHYHFICNVCGKVYDVPSSVAPDLLKNAQLATGFDIEKYDILFQGTCTDCFNKRKENK